MTSITFYLSACFSIIFYISSLFAEIQGSNSYTLEQICSIAQDSATALKIIQSDKAAGMTEVALYRSEAYPNISFNSGASYTSTSQATQKMQQAMMIAMFGDASSDNDAQSDFLYPDRINGYAFNWSLNLQQPLITFGKVRSALRLARMRECTLKKSSRLNTDLFYLEVIQNFSLAYLAQCEVSISKASVERAQQLLTRLQSDFEAGRTIKRELLRIEAFTQREKANCIAAEGNQRTATKRLLYSINFDDSTQFIQLRLDEHGTLTSEIPASGPGSTPFFLKKNEVAMYKEQVTYLQTGFFPTLNLTGSITNQFMTIDTNGLLEDLLPAQTPPEVFKGLGETFDSYNPKPNEYFNPEYFNYTIGVQLTWTLFDGNRTRAQCRQAKYKHQKALLELESMEKQDRIAVEEARNQITTVDSLLSAVELQIKASHQAFLQTEEDYKDGFTDFSTLLDTDKEYREAVRQRNSLKMQRVLALAQLRITLGLPVFGEQ